VDLKDDAEQDLVKFLKPGPVRPHYHMASPLVDGLIRNKLIPQLFPDSPSSAPPLRDEGKSLRVLGTLIESLKFFDKTLIHLAASHPHKTSKGRKCLHSHLAHFSRIFELNVSRRRSMRKMRENPDIYMSL